MKRILTLALVTLLTCSAYALQIPKTKIANIAVHEKDKMVTISFDLFLAKLNSDYKLTLTPVLYNGSRSQPLTPIIFAGRRRSIMDQRMKKQAEKGIIGQDQQMTSYRISVPYEEWMSQVSLKMNSSITGYGDDQSVGTLNLVSDKWIHYDIKPVFNATRIEPEFSELQELDRELPFLYPSTDYANRYAIFEKTRENEAWVVSFQQGDWSIDPFYKNNKQALDHINRVLALIDADPNASLKKIVIAGLASPEGSLASNDILAERRANSLKTLISERVKNKSNLFEIINGSEDWAGLKKLVEASQMPDREAVLEIMATYSIGGGREVELMKLDRGHPYRYMMTHFFPLLRNAGYIQIYYESTPDPQIAMINDAIQLMQEKQYDQALPLLLRISGDQQLKNMIGVCYMMTGEYTQATTYFKKAIAGKNSDASDAAANLEQIRMMQSIQR